MACRALRSLRWTPLLAACGLCLGAACERQPATEQAPQRGAHATQTPAPEHVFVVRGRIVALPDPTSPGGGTLLIAHEPIPDFVNARGQRVGMGAMTMPFVPAPGLDLSGLAVGDQVRFTWELRWSPPRIAHVTRIEKLPADPTPAAPGQP